MKLIKKALSVLLCVVIVLSGTSILSFARPESEDKKMPLIFISGFTGNSLYCDGEHVFPPSFDGITKEQGVRLVKSLLRGFLSRNYSDLVKTAGEELSELLDEFKKSAVNPDGTQDYNTDARKRPANRSYGFAFGTAERKIEDALGYYNTFDFVYDWRDSLVDVADDLDKFIDDVLRLTGAENVAIFGYSLGGQVAATYLRFYGSLGKVGKVVFVNSPLLGTKSDAATLDRDQLDVSISSALRLASFLNGERYPFEWLTEKVGIRFLNRAIGAILDAYVVPVALYWGSVWDMLPLEDYEPMKKQYLDEKEQKWLIEKSDKLHYEVMAKMPEIIDSALKQGISLSSITCTDCGIATARKVNGDCIVSAHGSSGANCTDNGKHFSANYKQLNTTCADPSHSHISPDRMIDASSALLPENSWYIIGEGHCQYDEDDYAVALLEKLMTGDSLKDVHTDPAFPQFRYGSSYINQVGVRFGDREMGYVGTGDDKITLENFDCEYRKSDDINVKYVKIRNGLLTRRININSLLKPGETKTINIRKLFKM
nr:alpha/beta hydrolase [Clostridiales bacterium]